MFYLEAKISCDCGNCGNRSEAEAIKDEGQDVFDLCSEVREWEAPKGWRWVDDLVDHKDIPDDCTDADGYMCEVLDARNMDWDTVLCPTCQVAMVLELVTLWRAVTSP